MRAFRFVGAYKRAAAHSTARGKTASMPALVCVYLIASDAHEPRALTPFLSQVFLTRCQNVAGWSGRWRLPFVRATNTDESEKSFPDARPSAMPSSADGASTACAMAPNGHG